MTPGQYGMGTPSPMSAPMTLGKRGFPFEPANLSALAPAREIRPKPPSGGPYGQPLSQIDQPPKKKRGRPTKAEAQAKAEAQSGMAESSTAPRPPTSVLSMNTPLAGQQMEPARPVQTPVEEARPVLPPVSRMNISSMLAVTPTGPGSASHSSSSSGKRRRGRTRSDPGDVQSAGPVGAGAPITQYESPYASMGGEAITSPAQSAMLRRREELGPPAQYPPREEQPPQGPPGQGQGRR